MCTLPLTKISYTNPPPNYDYSHNQNYSPFCHEWQRVRVSSRPLVSAGRARISILIIIVVVRVVIILGCLRCLKRRRGRLHKATKASLPSSKMVDTGVHLIQLSRKCIKVSIHAPKLHHDCIQSHTYRRSRGSGGGWSWRSGRSYHLRLGLPQAKLCKTLLYCSSVNGTHKQKVRRLRIDNGKMAKESRDSGRKNKLITSLCVPIDIYKG